MPAKMKTEKINWLDWSKSAFAKARRGKKLVLQDVSGGLLRNSTRLLRGKSPALS